MELFGKPPGSALIEVFFKPPYNGLLGGAANGRPAAK
jgi:hypothetical protein